MLKKKKILTKRKGILFIKNIPSNIFFSQLKNIFQKFGIIGKSFFCSEKIYKKKYEALCIRGIFGWIEFMDKVKAKLASNFFKKTNKHLKNKFLNWKCTYLKNFKWNNLENFFLKKF